ncbi:MAG: sulfatase [Verrucomicrobiota bacterium JB023]|nr:sulfatase [Verrucomicrobiota bacterium JB023]
MGSQASLISQGDTLKIDFGDTAPSEAALAEGYVQYNSVSGESVVLMTDGAGPEEDVTITVTGVDGSFVNNLDGSASGGSADATVYADHVAGNGTDTDTITVTVSGLDDSLTYELFAGMRRNTANSDWDHTYNVGGSQYAYTASGGFINSYQTYPGLSSSGGTFTFTLTDNVPGLVTSISEMRLTAVDELEEFWSLALDFGDTAPTNHFNDIPANGTYDSLQRLSDGTPMAGISVFVDGPTFYLGTGPNDSLTGLSSEYDVSNVTDWAGSTNPWTVTFYGLDDSLAYNIEGVIGGFTNNSNTDTTFIQAGTRTNVFTPETASADPRIARIQGAQSFGGILEISVRPGSKVPVLSTLMLTAVEGDDPTLDEPVLPNILGLTVEGESDVVLSLERAGENFLVQQSDDLQQFSTVPSQVEGENLDSVRLTGSENVDPNGDGKSFFRLERQPNFIIIFTDDQGYQDLGCYGSPSIKTPNIDQMAAEGMKFTSFYAQTVCGPSRAALMTGSYPMRVERHPDDDGTMVHPAMSLNEITLPEILKPLGYKTGMAGKWDLSGRPPAGTYRVGLGPHNQGFDETYWSVTSDTDEILEGETVVLSNPTRSSITRRFTDKAIEFIHANKDQPFFYYLAHPMPHTPIAASPDFLGTSDGGLYGDVIEELDYHTGRVLAAVKEAGLDENTYVIFTSDNGPWWIKQPNAGSADPLRSAKTSTYDGGLRVPFIIRAPGRVPAGTTSDLVCANLDLFPTIARLAGATLPDDRVLDGIDISDIFRGQQSELDRPFFFYQHEALRAVRRGEWKLHLVHSALDRTKEGTQWQAHVPPADRPYIEELTLYNLDDDIGETTNVAADHPEVVAALLEDLDFAKEDIGCHDDLGENSRQ